MSYPLKFTIDIQWLFSLYFRLSATTLWTEKVQHSANVMWSLVHSTVLYLSTCHVFLFSSTHHEMCKQTFKWRATEINLYWDSFQELLRSLKFVFYYFYFFLCCVNNLSFNTCMYFFLSLFVFLSPFNPSHLSRFPTHLVLWLYFKTAYCKSLKRNWGWSGGKIREEKGVENI